ncbi:hypothetical protein E2542_SST24905 [Spatholobus suberectus]|nr:hypothetical protein E2542_SST24905 [Spatholobus suberectus]
MKTAVLLLLRSWLKAAWSWYKVGAEAVLCRVSMHYRKLVHGMQCVLPIDIKGCPAAFLLKFRFNMYHKATLYLPNAVCVHGLGKLQHLSSTMSLDAVLVWFLNLFGLWS